MQSRYQEGQVWRYETRVGEENSTLTILLVESYPRVGTIVHICVEWVQLQPVGSPEGTVNRIAHMPFGEGALDASVTELAGQTSVLPDFTDGYVDWRRAFEAGDAGIFVIPVAQAVEFIEQAMNQ